MDRAFTKPSKYCTVRPRYILLRQKSQQINYYIIFATKLAKAINIHKRKKLCIKKILT